MRGLYWVVIIAVGIIVLLGTLVGSVLSSLLNALPTVPVGVLMLP